MADTGTTWHPDVPETYRNTVVTGDCRQLVGALPDASVDLILCDPVYNEVWQYAWLVVVGERLLRPCGSIIAECGSIHRFAAECAMHEAAQGTRLIHRPILNELFTGGFTYIHMHRTHRACNHMLWFEADGIRPGRGCPRTAFWGSKDKSRHVWGDGERSFAQLVEWFTQPGDTVLDPFAGGATVPAVCRARGRNVIGFEINPESACAGRARMRDVHPLFMPPTASQPAALLEMP
mgnify:CR=1 FL=1